MVPPLLMLKETTFRVPEVELLRWNVSGLLGQADTQSTLFFTASSSFPPPTSSSLTEGCGPCWCVFSTSNMIHPSSCGKGPSQWKLPLELLCPDSCCSSRRIFSVSPLRVEDEDGARPSPHLPHCPGCSAWGTPPGTLRLAGGGRGCLPFLTVVVVGQRWQLL